MKTLMIYKATLSRPVYMGVRVIVDFHGYLFGFLAIVLTIAFSDPHGYKLLSACDVSLAPQEIVSGRLLLSARVIIGLDE